MNMIVAVCAAIAMDLAGAVQVQLAPAAGQSAANWWQSDHPGGPA